MIILIDIIEERVERNDEGRRFGHLLQGSSRKRRRLDRDAPGSQQDERKDKAGARQSHDKQILSCDYGP